MNMQRNSLPTTRETTWQGNSGIQEGPQKVPWKRQFRDKGLPLQLQFIFSNNKKTLSTRRSQNIKIKILKEENIPNVALETTER